MDDSHYVEMEFHSAERNKAKGVGTIVEDDDIGVLHVKTERPRAARYWGVLPPDMLQAQPDGVVTVKEQLFETSSHYADESCENRLDYPWARETIREISSGSMMNNSFITWEFNKDDKHKSIKFIFPSLSRVTHVIISPELKSRCNITYKDRSSTEWKGVTFIKDKSMKEIRRSSYIDIFGGFKETIERVVTDTIRFDFMNTVEKFDIFEFGMIGCFLGSQGINIRDKDIPLNLLWGINLRDLVITTDPVFAVEPKSSVPKGQPNIDDDTQRDNFTVNIKLADDISTCNIDDKILDAAMHAILGNPIAIFMNFKGVLKMEDGQVCLTLKFTAVSYNVLQRELLKAEIPRKVKNSGQFMPCSKSVDQYSLGTQTNVSEGLRPVDYFLVIVATVAMLVVILVGALFLQRRLRRKPGYTTIESSASITDVREGAGPHQLTMESIITIVDHVMSKMKEENWKQENASKDESSNKGTLTAAKPNRSERGDDGECVKKVASRNIERFCRDSQTSV